jgi:hypothetical protein
MAFKPMVLTSWPPSRSTTARRMDEDASADA